MFVVSSYAVGVSGEFDNALKCFICECCDWLNGQKYTAMREITSYVYLKLKENVRHKNWSAITRRAISYLCLNYTGVGDCHTTGATSGAVSAYPSAAVAFTLGV